MAGEGCRVDCESRSRTDKRCALEQHAVEHQDFLAA
jgi:hypothetical protein